MMKKLYYKFLFIPGILGFLASNAYSAGKDRHVLMIAPATITHQSVTLLWDDIDKDVNEYTIFVNGKKVVKSSITNSKLKDLKPLTVYTVRVTGKNRQGRTITTSNLLKFTTRKKGKIINILNYGAKAGGLTLNTAAIQNAVNACEDGGIVYVPAGDFKTGALFLKSNMTLYIEKGGRLKGSIDPKDYEPFVYNRFEGWEMNTFASLINAGTMNKDGRISLENLSISGLGTISGGGERLAKAMISRNGMRSRGRLISLLNCKNVNIEGLKIEESPCWTIHYVYSSKITCQGLTISSFVENGDGIDPDSSTDSYIFNCKFWTNDDCIAIKSGKNPEGYFIAKPSQNIQITHCEFVKGHGISIGSEISGGIKNILVRHCKAGNLIFGLQIKGTKERGGFVEQVIVRDSELRKITIFSALPYNNDGAPAPMLPYFKDFEFRDLDMSKADSTGTVIYIDGFEHKNSYTRNLVFKNIQLPEHAVIDVRRSDHIIFQRVSSVKGIKPKLKIDSLSARIAME
ncbi:polygalacturonase [Pedobacter sp. AK017]|uniref:glycosyl hydrolase family 28 protein n=1 Tax=Pedobacter sp. AK017 TaxID=2723073 RepID=UPI00161A6568|nr:glycoside hydrolase family 28 protein [Pedobacter sp. AK017]MBB5441194.1 polygalacturonase [Pedobacter sp. AK017]